MRLPASLAVAASVVLLGCPPPVSPDTLVITPSPLSVDLGATKTVTATRDGAPARAASWSSGDSAIATVATNGDGSATVRGVAQGSTTLTATLGEQTATVAVTVGPATLTRIELAPGSPSFALGTKLQLRATAVSSDGTKRDVTTETSWRSLDTSIVTVAADGEATSVALGRATVSGIYEGRSAAITVNVTSATLTALDVTPATADLITGTTRQLTATGTFSDGTRQNLSNQVTWTTSATNVATVDGVGLVRAVTMGTATITAARGGVTATATINTTTATLTSIAIDPTTPSIAKGLTRQLSVNGRYSNNLTQPITSMVAWSSSATAVATVSNAGLLTAVAPGTSTITATAGGFTSTLALTVSDAQITSIVVTPAAPSLGVGRTLQLVATGHFTDGTTEPVTADATWTSATAASATVSNAAGSQGLVSAIALGSSVISATIGSVTGTVTVTITAAELASIAVTPATPTLAKGLTQQFTATGTYTDNSSHVLESGVTWATDDAGVVDVDDAGVARAVSEGVAVVSAESEGITGSTTVTVGPAALVSIAVTPDPATIDGHDTLQFTATGTWSDLSTSDVTSAVAWSTADAGVATIDASGLATGVRAGETEVVATQDDVQGSATLTVTRTLTSITVTPAVATAPVNGTQQFTATGHYSDGSTEDLTAQVTWSSSAASVATVDAGGLATGHSIGVATITATQGTHTDSALLTVAL